MLTEAEAKTKWCPQVTYCTNELDVIQDGRTPLYAHQLCEASGCMAWRWMTNVGEDVFARGYCGLAGHPYPAFAIDAGGQK